MLFCSIMYDLGGRVTAQVVAGRSTHQVTNYCSQSTDPPVNSYIEVCLVSVFRRFDNRTPISRIFLSPMNSPTRSFEMFLTSCRSEPGNPILLALCVSTQLWNPKKQPQPFDYPINPKIPKTKPNPKPLSSDPSKLTKFRTYSTLYG